jgi:NADP-dependent 3-hydroxy acid dehydrogenase YdfG
MMEGGASMVLLDKDEKRCQVIADVLRPTGARTLALACDIANPQSVSAAEHALRVSSRCDIQFNSAGMLLPGSLAIVPLEEWILLAVNPIDYLLRAQAFGKALIEHGRGTIMHTASLQAATCRSSATCTLCDRNRVWHESVAIPMNRCTRSEITNGTGGSVKSDCASISYY